MSTDTTPAPAVRRYGFSLIQAFAGVAALALLVIGYAELVKMPDSAKILVVWSSISTLFMMWVGWTLYRGKAKRPEVAAGVVVGLIVVCILAAILFPVLQQQRHHEHIKQWKLAHPGQRWPFED